MTKLTDKRIESIKPAAKAKEHRDGHMPGLYLAVHPSGVRSWNYRYRSASKGRKLTIGRWPAITPEAARKCAQQAAAKVAGGADPHQEKKASRRREVEAKAPVRDTIEKVSRQYLKHAAVEPAPARPPRRRGFCASMCCRHGKARGSASSGKQTF